MNLLLLGVITILFAQCNNDEISTTPNIPITNRAFSPDRDGNGRTGFIKAKLALV